MKKVGKEVAIGWRRDRSQMKNRSLIDELVNKEAMKPSKAAWAQL